MKNKPTKHYKWHVFCDSFYWWPSLTRLHRRRAYWLGKGEIFRSILVWNYMKLFFKRWKSSVNSGSTLRWKGGIRAQWEQQKVLAEMHGVKLGWLCCALTSTLLPEGCGKCRWWSPHCVMADAVRSQAPGPRHGLLWGCGSHSNRPPREGPLLTRMARWPTARSMRASGGRIRVYGSSSSWEVAYPGLFTGHGGFNIFENWYWRCIWFEPCLFCSWSPGPDYCEKIGNPNCTLTININLHRSRSSRITFHSMNTTGVDQETQYQVSFSYFTLLRRSSDITGKLEHALEATWCGW